MLTGLLVGCGTSRGWGAERLERASESTANHLREEMLHLIAGAHCAERLRSMVEAAGPRWRGSPDGRARILQTALAEAQADLDNLRSRRVTPQDVATEEALLVDLAVKVIADTYRVKQFGRMVVKNNEQRAQHKKWISEDSYLLDTISSVEGRLGDMEAEVRRIVGQHTVAVGHVAFRAQMEAKRTRAEQRDEAMYADLPPEDVLALDRIGFLFADCASAQQTMVWCQSLLEAKRQVESLQAAVGPLVTQGSGELNEYYQGTKWFDLGGRYQWRPFDPN